MKNLLNNIHRPLLVSLTSLIVVSVCLIVGLQFLSSGDLVDPELVNDHDPVNVFPDFTSIQSVAVKKQQFLDYLQDYIVAENTTIAVSYTHLRAHET